MQEFVTFCNSIKELIESYPKMDIGGARKIVSAINEYLYTTHEHIGTIEKFGSTFDFFSDFHRFWHNNHEEILGCTIDNENVRKLQILFMVFI